MSLLNGESPWLLRGFYARGAPVPDVVGIEGDAEEVGGDEAELRGAQGYDANDQAIGAGDHPALPDFSANKNGREDRENAGDVVEPEHVRFSLL